MNDKRFSWLAGQEYDLRAKAVPHHEAMQTLLATTLFDLLWKDFPWEWYVIEVWCGTWYTTKKILAQKQCAGVVAVDNEPIMLVQAKRELAIEHTLRKVHFYEFDALEFLRDCLHTTSNIVSAMTIHNFDKVYRTKVLEKIYERLVPQWIFINADKYALDDPAEHQKTLDRQIVQFQKVAQEYNNPAFEKERTAHYLRDNQPDLLMKQQEAIDEMKKIGFRDIQIIFREQMEAILVARK